MPVLAEALRDAGLPSQLPGGEGGIGGAEAAAAAAVAAGVGPWRLTSAGEAVLAVRQVSYVSVALGT